MAGNLFQGVVGLSAGTVTTAPIPPVEQNNEVLQSILIELQVLNKLTQNMAPINDDLQALRTDTAAELLTNEVIVY